MDVSGLFVLNAGDILDLPSRSWFDSASGGWLKILFTWFRV